MASQDNINVFEPDLRDSAILPLQPDRPGPVISYLTRPMVPSPKQRRRDTLRGIASFVPFLSGELARVEGDKLGETLGLLDALGPAAVPAKAAAKVATKAVDLNKGIASIPTPTNPRYDLTRHQEDLFTGNPIADANKMYDRALRLGPEFKSQIDNVATELNLETTLPELGIKIDGDTLLPVGTTKKIPRIIEKAKGKYKGDISQVTDPMRSRIVVNNPAEEEAVAKLLGQKYDVFDKGREIKEGTGFVDRKINIKFTGSNGEPLVAEVGIITAPMWRASDKAHKKYERFRSLFPQGMPTDPIELGKINRNVRLEGEKLLKEMDEIFKVAKDQIDPDFYYTRKGISGLHGSPAKFDKFDMTKVPLDEFGMPKGLDRYGRGHYFSARNIDGKKTAASYAGDDGFVYKVEVPSDKLLRVDEPLSRQHPTLRKKLKEILPDDFVKKDPTGDEITTFVENGPPLTSASKLSIDEQIKRSKKIAASFNDPKGVKFSAYGSPKKVPYGGKIFGEADGSLMVVPDDSIIKITKRSSKTDVKKFSEGGYVTSGSSGRSLPMTPNFVSKSVLDIFEPSTKKSTTWFGAATVQSGLPEVKKYPKSASPIGFSTAGPSSHVKYNVSIDSSLQKFTNNYNTKDINIFET
jgi:hypothetical protein